MYKRISSVMLPLLIFTLIAAVVWGYQTNQTKNKLLIKSENQYQRAFHDLSYQMDNLQNELGKAVAVHSDSLQYHRKCLINVWRLASQAQSDINQLPLALLPFNKTEDFLSHLTTFSYRTSVRDLSKNPLTPNEMKTLTTLHDRSKEISAELDKVQEKVLNHQLKWTAVETALASQKGPKDNSIIDGFKLVDKKINEYSEVDWGPTMASFAEKKDLQILGKPVTMEDVKQKAAKFLKVPVSHNLKIVEVGKGTSYNAYSVTFAKNSAESINMDFSKNGGKLIYYLNSRAVSTERLNLTQARTAAEKFLQSNGYANMTPTSYDTYNHSVSISFVPVQQDVLIYPQILTVNLALDNGQITGLQASSYVMENKKRDIKGPTLTLEEAKKKLNAKFRASHYDLAIIKNDLDEEVLCYEFVGTINGSKYRAFVNADNGYEEKLEEIRDVKL